MSGHIPTVLRSSRHVRLFILLILPLFVQTALVVPKVPIASPEASTSLICPTEDTADCYPSIFQPTIQFQHVRPGQSLPPGLHVRLNIATGEKEARLNVPEEDEGRNDAVLVIDNTETSAEESDGRVRKSAEEEQYALHMRLRHPPAGHGERRIPGRQKAVKKPHHSVPQDGSEASLYENAVAILIGAPSVSNNLALDEASDALAVLTDLAHSLDWGIAITRDADLCHALLSILDPAGNQPASIVEDVLRPPVLLLLGVAIQNNPTANAELQDFQNTNRLDLVDMVLELLLEQHKGAVQSTKDVNSMAVFASRAIFFLSQFCADEGILSDFVQDKFPSTKSSNSHQSGLNLFLQLSQLSLITKGDPKVDKETSVAMTKVQIRLAHFITDYVTKIAVLIDSSPQPSGTAADMLKPWCVVFSEEKTHLNRLSTAKGDSAYSSYSAAQDSIVHALKGVGAKIDWKCDQSSSVKSAHGEEL